MADVKRAVSASKIAASGIKEGETFHSIVLGKMAGAITQKHAELGGDGGLLGAPTGDEGDAARGGRFREYAGGVIYWTADTGAHEVHGAILELWTKLGRENGFLGYPLTDESTTPDGVGRFNHFEGGSIYWTPQTGAHEVHGAIRDLWSKMGWERSFLGYPVTDELATQDGVGRFSDFQGGQIAWSPQLGAAVSARFGAGKGSGGLLKPLTHDHPEGQTPEIRRRVTAAATMSLTDDETAPFESDEHSTASDRGDAVVTNRKMSALFKMQDGAGDELRVVLELTAQAHDNGDVNVVGKALLFEDTTEAATDLDGEESIDILVPRDQTVSNSIQVVNSDEGGDHAEIALTLHNMAV